MIDDAGTPEAALANHSHLFYFRSKAASSSKLRYFHEFRSVGLLHFLLLAITYRHVDNENDTKIR